MLLIFLAVICAFHPVIDAYFEIADIEEHTMKSCVILIEEQNESKYFESYQHSYQSQNENESTNVGNKAKQRLLIKLFSDAKHIFDEAKQSLSVIFNTMQYDYFVENQKKKWSNGAEIEFNYNFLESQSNGRDYWPHSYKPWYKPQIVGFRKRFIDRSCLYRPDYYLADMPSAFLYPGYTELSEIVQFVNEVCGSYLMTNGELSNFGKFKYDILMNPFRINEYSHYSTMADIYESGIKPFQDGLPRENTHEKHNLQLAQCDQISMPSWDDFFKNHFLKSRPVVIKEGCKKWPALKKWTNDYLMEKFGNNKVHVKLTPNGVFEGCDNITNWNGHDKFYIPEAVKSKLHYSDLVVVRPAPGSMHFGEFMDFIMSSTEAKNNVSAYIEYASIESFMPGISEDIIEMPFLDGNFKPGHLHHKNVWLSDGNTLGKLHFDAFENFLCQLSGVKQFTLFEPHNNTRLYEGHIQESELSFDKSSMTFKRDKLKDSTSMVMSPVDLLNPDFQRFPKFRDAVTVNCTVGEGDVLYMPSFWWHEVKSWPDPVLKRNLAVNFWYDPFLVKEFPCAECKLDTNHKYDYLLHQFLMKK